MTYFGTRVTRRDSIGESVSQARLPFGEEITSSLREINPRKVKADSLNPYAPAYRHLPVLAISGTTSSPCA